MNLERARKLLATKNKKRLQIYPILYDNYQIMHYNIIKNINTMTKDLIKPNKESAFYFPIHNNPIIDSKNLEKISSQKTLTKNIPSFNFQNSTSPSNNKRVIYFRNKINNNFNFKSQKCLDKGKPIKLKKKYNSLLKNLFYKDNFTISFKNLNSNKIFDDIFKENNEMYASLYTENSEKYNSFHSCYNIKENVYHKKLEKYHRDKTFKQLPSFKLSNNDIGFNEIRSKKIISNTFRDNKMEKSRNRSKKSFSTIENKGGKSKSDIIKANKLNTEKKFVLLKKFLRKQNDVNCQLLIDITKENVSSKDKLKVELAKLNSYNFRIRSKY